MPDRLQHIVNEIKKEHGMDVPATADDTAAAAAPTADDTSAAAVKIQAMQRGRAARATAVEPAAEAAAQPARCLYCSCHLHSSMQCPVRLPYDCHAMSADETI